MDNQKINLKEFIKSRNFKVIAVFALILIVFCIGFLAVSVSKILDVTTEYNEAVEAYNKSSAEYKESVNLVNVDNIAGMLSDYEQLEIESVSVANGLRVFFGRNSADKILKDKELIEKLTKDIKNSLVIAKEIYSPSTQWVIAKLDSVDEIIEWQAVSKDNDPNGQLGKEGGYTSCVYFNVKGINQDDIYGESIVEKGTDVGGAIEVYATKEDAENRCKYLSEFDGTFLYSGSYAIVGTVVIRTSYLLSDEQQYDLTDKITRAFTKVIAK